MSDQPIAEKSQRSQIEKLKYRVQTLEKTVADLKVRLEALEKWQQWEKELAMGEDL